MVRVAMAQVNPTVGDLDANVGLSVDAIRRAESSGAQIVALPELMITGYPPEDLLLRDAFVDANRRALEEVARATGEVMAVVGFVDASHAARYNAAAICSRGEVIAVYHKHLLPNYGVFDERRYFTPGKGHVLLEAGETTIGVCVCEDAWSPDGPVVAQGRAGAQVIVIINASPFHRAKLEERTEMLADRARRAGASIVYVNTVGGQDELVFDGGSMVLSGEGELLARLPQFDDAFATVDVPPGKADRRTDPSVRRLTVELAPRSGRETYDDIAPGLDDEEEVYRALVLGLRDYARKNGFRDAVLGLSGGIDSSLTAAIAADALGAEHVVGVAMPSEFSTSHSLEDALQLADNLGITCHQIPIKRAYSAYLDMLDDTFPTEPMSVAEENLQARIRGNILMFISNRFGHLVLVTGNKSEAAVGYATLYGDMAGGFGVLKDLLKRDVYALARWRNRDGAVIPESVLSKAPSAELRHDQKDEDSLPPYEVLDAILELYVEGDRSLADIVAAGYDPAVVEEVLRLVDRSEYKRRQAPPGIKVTAKAFGRDRRLPITNRWREGPAAGEEREAT
ncbi:MAG TPA: NAD+ synthase [Actinomycetota bacterium]|nr:NAD+ synthase [Actinomycetota bacterium]